MPGSIVEPLCLILCSIPMEQQNVLGSLVGRCGVPTFVDEWTWV
jgi:hypothetical protein